VDYVEKTVELFVTSRWPGTVGYSGITMKFAVFDIDGTLTKTFAVDGECYQQAFVATFGIDSINSDWADYDHVTDSGVMNAVFNARFGRIPDSSEISGFVERFVELLQERYRSSEAEFHEVPGATFLFVRFGPPSAWRAAIATGGWKASAEFKLRTAGISVKYIPAAFAEDGPSRTAIVRTAVERALSSYGQKAFEKIVSVGDAIWDVDAARQLDLPFVGVGEDDRAVQLRNVGASHVIENLVDHDNFFSSLEAATVPQAERPANDH
jgi:phosphoglycolate phosphatase-like HAD superfamily hydrolase